MFVVVVIGSVVYPLATVAVVLCCPLPSQSFRRVMRIMSSSVCHRVHGTCVTGEAFGIHAGKNRNKQRLEAASRAIFLRLGTTTISMWDRNDE